jgi:hypothetical protein
MSPLRTAIRFIPCSTGRLPRATTGECVFGCFEPSTRTRLEAAASNSPSGSRSSCLLSSPGPRARLRELRRPAARSQSPTSALVDPHAFRRLIDASGVHREYRSGRLRIATAKTCMISAELTFAESAASGVFYRGARRSKNIKNFWRGGRDLNPRPPA